MIKNKHKTKIAIVIDTIESPTAGTEKQLLLLLNNLNQDKFEPTLCCLQSSEWLKAKFDLCPLHIIGIKSFKYPISYLKIWAFSRFLGKNHFDIVQTHFSDSNIAGILAARLAGINTVISTRRGLPYWKNKFGLRLLKKLNRWVTLFITNSYSTKKWAAELEGIPEDKIQVVYNGIDLEPYLKLSPETRERYRRILEIPESSPAIGIVANLRPVKGIDVFLKAAQLVNKEIPEAKFIIVGDGPQRENLIRLASKLSLNGSVRFLGKREDVASILSAFDVAVLSSHSESFSNSVLEYLAVGLPVVCTDVGGCREVVEDGVTGLVVPVGDCYALSKAMLKIILDKDPRIKMGNKARDSILRSFSLGRFLEETEGLYRKILN